MAKLVFDAAGNLYGTTTAGGDFGWGSVFKLVPNSSGNWTESVLHAFCSLQNCTDGQVPNGELILDAAGNLYGTTSGGGDFQGGTVFRLTPNSDGDWTESILHSFDPSSDGFQPNGGLIFDKVGNLYGTTSEALHGGTVFKLTPQSDGSWTESVLYTFCSLPHCADGNGPLSSLAFDAAGNLYGTTIGGGGTCPGLGCGVVFKLTSNSDGSWSESVLHHFLNSPGANPHAAVTFDAAGNLYGTTVNDFVEHSVNYGIVFKMTPNSAGGWVYSVLHVFRGAPGYYPFGGVVLDQAGNLYGTTISCVFEIRP